MMKTPQQIKCDDTKHHAWQILGRIVFIATIIPSTFISLIHIILNLVFQILTWFYNGKFKDPSLAPHKMYNDYHEWLKEVFDI